MNSHFLGRLAIAGLVTALHLPAWSEGSSSIDLPAERALSAASVVGVQIAVRNTNLASTKPEVLRCLLSLEPDVFVSAFRQSLALALTRDEIAATETIYGGPLGSKIRAAGISRVYRSHGLEPPDGDIVFSPAENAILMRFVKTSAGEKLFRRNVLDDPAATKVQHEAVVKVYSDCKGKAAAR